MAQYSSYLQDWLWRYFSDLVYILQASPASSTPQDVTCLWPLAEAPTYMCGTCCYTSCPGNLGPHHLFGTKIRFVLLWRLGAVMHSGLCHFHTVWNRSPMQNLDFPVLFPHFCDGSVRQNGEVRWKIPSSADGNSNSGKGENWLEIDQNIIYIFAAPFSYLDFGFTKYPLQ